MKTVRIKYCNFWDSFDPKNNLFYGALVKHFNVEFSDNPDFVICSNRGAEYEFLKYDCPRIMLMGENISPDFTLIDYCIGFDYIEFGDRYFRMPEAFQNNYGSYYSPHIVTEEEADKILKYKKCFCNFVYRHQSSHNVRERLFKELEKYKPVVSPGSFMNNTGSNGCTREEKFDFVRKSKFTIACDSIAYPGFVTEKIIHAFYNHSIPIYFGNPKVDDYFNPKAFIWCKSQDDIPNTIERVKHLDTHDDEYKKMLMEYPLSEYDLVGKMQNQLEDFLVHIFSQEPKDAYRRVRYFAAEKHEAALLELYNQNYKNVKAQNKIKSLKRKIGEIIK